MFVCISAHNSREGNMQIGSIDMRILFLQLINHTSDWKRCRKICKLPFLFLFFSSRFGQLINVYLVAGKNVGYAKFADRASASEAITALHGKIVNGVRLKVRLADSPSEEPNKRQRTY